MKYIITLNEKTITIENGIITVNAPGGVLPTVKLTYNQSHVLKFNKTSISTCNIEFLVFVLNNDAAVFKNVYGFIKYRSLGFNDLKTINKIGGVTRAAFYAAFNNINENGGGDLDGMNIFVQFFESCSTKTRREIIADHICYNHEKKMDGIISISSYVGNNAFCKARCNNCPGAICKYCYAESLTAQRVNLKNKLQRIHAIFTSCRLQACDIPVLDTAKYPYFRFESFGDLNNTLQFENYNLFAAVNNNINCTIWTKNPGIIQACINNGLQLANNLVIGLSSLYLNTPAIDTARRYSFIRFLFTVYDDEYIKAHNIVINCGAKHCLTCGICYKYLHEYKTGLYIINERKK